jgi:hypothetical protein
MKQIIPLALRALWRRTSRVRRPLMVRFDARVDRLAVGLVEDRMRPIIDALAVSEHRLERVEASLARADRAASHMIEEVDLVLNGLSREIFRLQARVELLQRALAEDARAAGTGLSLVDEAVEGAPHFRNLGAVDRPRVG